MPHSYPHLLSLLLNQPLLITPEKARVLLGVMAPRAGWSGQLIVAGDETAGPVPFTALSDPYMTAVARLKAEQLMTIADGVAIVPIHGTLVQKNGIHPSSGMTGYDGVLTKLRAAAADPNVRGVVLDINSPGGQVAGCFDVVDEVFALRAKKPVLAVATETMASAAYAIGAAADRVVVPRTGYVGSVGIVVLHADYSEHLKQEGITVTLIHSGAHKVDGNPFQRLDAKVRERIEGDVNETAALLFAYVAKGRGMAEDAVRKTEAMTYRAEDALAVGFADAVMKPEDAFNQFVSALAAGTWPASFGASPQPGAAASAQSTNEGTMHMNPTTAPAAAAGTTQPAAPQPTPAPAPAAPQPTPAPAPAAAASGTDQKARIKAITGCDEAQGRKALAEHFAFDTDMTPEAAKAALALAPKEGATNALAEAMGKVPNPAVNASGGPEAEAVAAARAAQAAADLNPAAIYARRSETVAGYAAGLSAGVAAARRAH